MDLSALGDEETNLINSLDKPRLPHPLESPGNQGRCRAKRHEVNEEFKANDSPFPKIDRDLSWVG